MHCLSAIAVTALRAVLQLLLLLLLTSPMAKSTATMD
jgi:hypothetical protein